MRIDPREMGRKLVLLFCVILVVRAVEDTGTWREQWEEQKKQLQSSLLEILTNAEDKYVSKKADLKKVAEQLADAAQQNLKPIDGKINSLRIPRVSPAARDLEVSKQIDSIVSDILGESSASKQSFNDKVDSAIDKVYPGFKKAAESYNKQQSDKASKIREQIDQLIKTRSNDTQEKFAEFAASANEKLRQAFEQKKADQAAQKKKTQDALAQLKPLIQNATSALANKIKTEQKQKADAKAALSQKLKDKVQAKLKETASASVRDLADVNQFLSDASGASGWRSISTILTLICFLITIVLLVLIFRQLRHRAAYQRLDGNVNPAPQQLSYNPNLGSSATFVPSQTAKNSYPQLF